VVSGLPSASWLVTLAVRSWFVTGVVGEGIQGAPTLPEGLGVAVAGQIRDEEPPFAGERRRDEAPVRGHAAETVDEEERRAGASGEVTDAAPADDQLPRLEPVQIRFAVRHLRGIFFPG